MAFEGLSDKLQSAFKKLTGKGKLNEQNIKEAMREVRMALLEADVNYLVVKDFCKKVTERCVGQEVLESLTLEEYKSIDPLFEADVFEAIDLSVCVEKRISEGGTSFASVDAQIAYVKEVLNA